MSILERFPRSQSHMEVMVDGIGGDGDGACHVSRRKAHEAEISVGAEVIIGRQELLEQRASSVESADSQAAIKRRNQANNERP